MLPTLVITIIQLLMITVRCLGNVEIVLLRAEPFVGNSAKNYQFRP